MANIGMTITSDSRVGPWQQADVGTWHQNPLGGVRNFAPVEGGDAPHQGEDHECGEEEGRQVEGMVF